ncbi:MAG: GAF domain-containing protein [Planctomycetes bacterium]|nr:GAF domain-containing protein [Planctomycetota bacterium]
MRSTLNNILNALECESGSILLYDQDADELSLVEIIGTDGSYGPGQRQEISRGIAGWVATNRQPLLIEDIDKDVRFAHVRNTSRSYKTNSLLSAPLLDNDRLIGVVNVSDKRSGDAFGTNDLEMLQALTETMTESIRNGMSYRKLSEKNLSLSEKVEEATRRLVNANFEVAHLQGFHDSILRSISLGLVTFDKALRVTFYNEAASETFGFTEDDVGRKSLLKLRIEPKGQQKWPEVLEACVSEGKATTLQQVPYKSPDEKELLLDVTCAPLSMHNCEFGGTLVVEDVGRALQIERRLAQAEQLATIGKLAASVAHELNNPLDGVLRFTNMALKHNNGNEKVADYLSECRIGLQRMSKIVRSLLDYSRTIGKGIEDHDVNELIASATRELRPLQIRNNITLKTNFGGNIPSARFSNFSEVFSNIIRNAYEAMPLGGDFVISTEMEDSNLMVRFEDTGKGISPETMNKIFEPFFTTKDTAQCTGLGLTICSDIVAKHGGSIQVESTKGQGTTFEVRVPL